MSKNAKIAIVVIAILVISIAAYFIFRKKKMQATEIKQGPDQGTKVVTDPTAPETKWIQNKFPLDVNMQGDYVLALQRALNRINPNNKVAEDGKFGPSTKTKLLLSVSAAQSVLPMSGAAWQAIIIDSNK